MSEKSEELRSEEINMKIADIDALLAEFEKEKHDIKCMEEEAEEVLWRSRKDAERMSDCWSGGPTEYEIEEVKLNVDGAMNKIRYAADEARDRMETEGNRLHRKKEDLQEELNYLQDKSERKEK